MAKPKSIIDSFMTGLLHDAKNAVDSLKEENYEKNSIDYENDDENAQKGSPKDHHSITTVSPKDHHSITIVSPKDHDNITKGSPKDHQKVSPKDHHFSVTKKRTKNTSDEVELISLSKSQTMVFVWLKNRGQKGYFNKNEIVQMLSMPYITIRKAIKKLENTGSLRLKYDSCQKKYEYAIEHEERLKLDKNTSDEEEKDHHSITIVSPSLNSSSSFFKKITTTTCARAFNSENFEFDAESIIIEIMSSDPEYKYWLDQQVTPKQVMAWRQEFGLEVQTVLNNLCYARWQILMQKIEINKSPAHYVYGIMQKNNGVVNKPTGYKTMRQLDLEFYEAWSKKRAEHEHQMELFKKQVLKAEIEPKIAALLEKPDLENKYIQAALAEIKSQPRKQRIRGFISSGKLLDENSRVILRNYLETILAAEVALPSTP